MTVTARILGACVSRALKASGKSDIGPENDVYWHTREACVELGLRSGIGVAAVVEAIRDVERDELWSEDSIPAVPAEVWAEVAHPDVLAREVLEA